MKKIAILICFAFVSVLHSVSCDSGYRPYLPIDYYMFRACGDNMDGNSLELSKGEMEKRIENSQAWVALTSRSIPYEDIIQVVYKWNLEQLVELHKATQGGFSSYTTNNRFASWIVKNKDSEISNFLILAKRTELVRFEKADPWYYAVEGDEIQTEMENIVKEARQYKGKRLKDRYALQIIRILFTLNRFQDCAKIWNEYESSFRNNVIRELTLGYVAGAYLKLGYKDVAAKFYKEAGQLHDAYVCEDNRNKNLFEWIYEHNPDAPTLIDNMQKQIHSIERSQGKYWANAQQEYYSGQEDYEKIYPIVKRIIKEKKCKDMSVWYYTGAFLADKLNNTTDVEKFLNMAKRNSCSEDLKASIRVLDIYHKVSQSKTYSMNLEKHLYDEFQWLDSMIVNKLDKKTMDAIKDHGTTYQDCGYSLYYWNDMMRKIIIGELVPLCIKSGYKTRALQYLNMADNRIYMITETNDRTLDYSNDFFINMDSIGVKYLIRLDERIANPLCAMDSFLNERSYTERQYLHEIIGTQMIANMRYKDAIKYLRKVSSRFNKSISLYYWYYMDPFTTKKMKKKDPCYKLHFAEKMLELEQKIKSENDPNDKAETMLTYAYGLQNSIGEYCWPLTTYYWGEFMGYDYYSQYQRDLRNNIEKAFGKQKNSAFAMFTDSERAAKAYYNWNMFKTAATRYSDTKVAKLIKGSCDKLIDYQTKPLTPPRLRP